MTDRKGDPAKQSADCKIDDAPPRCPHMECVSETMSGESYRCARCGEAYKLYYEDMA